MKEISLLKLRGIFLAFISFLCVISIQAQTWTAPVPVGSAITNNAQYYVYSVGAKAFLDRGGEWDSQAIVTFNTGALITTVANSTLWNLEYENSSAKCLKYDPGSWMFTDGAAASYPWDIQVTDAVNNVYSIQVPSGNANYIAGQYAGTSSTLYSSNREGTVYDVRYNRTASDYTKWMFVTATELAKYNAKVLLDRYMTIAKLTRSSVNLTSYISTYNIGTTADINTAVVNLKAALTYTDKTTTISNSGFSSAPTTGWTVSANYGWNNSVLEYWHQDNKSLSQIINGLPAGVYMVKAQGFQRPVGLSTGDRTNYTNGSDILGSKLYVTASSITTFIPLRSIYSETTCPSGTTVDGLKFPNSTGEARAAFDANLYENELGYVIVDGTGSITLGMNVYYQPNGSVSKDGDWNVVDNFRLYYYGVTNPTINLSKSSFDLSVPPYNTTFDIVGKYLTSDVTMTLPAGITLAGTNVVDNGNGTYKILVANANNATNTVTATWDQATTVGGNITIGSSNSEFTNETIAVTADVANVWNGSTWSYGSAPSASNTKAIITGTYNGAGITCSDLIINASTTFTTNTSASGNVTLTSTLALGSKTLSLTGNLSASGYTLDGTVSFQGASAQTATATALNNVVVNNATGVTLGGNTTVNGTISFTSGNVNTGANTLTLTGAAPATGSGGYIVTGSSGTIVCSGSSAQTLSNLNGVVYNLTVNNANGVTLGEADILSGTLTLTSGILTNTNPLTLANGVTIVRSAGTLSAVPTFGTTVNVNYTGAVTTGNELPTTASYPTALNNLTIGAAVSLNAATTVNGTLALSNNLTTGSNTLTLTKAGTPISGSGYIVTGTTGTVNYAGSSAQTISNLNGTVYNLTVANPITATVSGAITINGNLNLTNASSILAVSNNITLNGDMPGSGYIDGGGSYYSIYCNGSSLLHLRVIGVYNLNINNPAGVILGKNLTFNNDNGFTNLNLAAGQLDNSAYTLSLRNGATITRTAGSLTSAPIFGTTVKLVYDGSSAQTTGAEIPVATGVLSDMTISNPVGVTLNSNAKVNGTLTINSGKVLSVAAGKQLTATSTFTNSGTLNLLSTAADGTATILTPASIGGTGGVVNVQQYLTSGRNWYVSSPVGAATTAALSTATSVVSYDEVHGSSAPWVTESGSLTPMKGYISTATTTNAAITFTGTLNTGSQSIALTRTVGQTKEGFNLVGNPYPSNLTWTEAIATAANTLSTIWYRTRVASAYAFHTFNATGGIGSPIEVTGVIPPMQAFWVRANAGGGTLSFDNTMRSHSVTSNPLKARSATKVAQQLVRLQVSNGTNSDEAVIYFNANASNGYDAYDSPKMTNANTAIPEIYTMGGTEKLVINGLNSVAPNEVLPLGFTTGESNSFTIKATQFSSFDGDTKVYLKDNLLNTELELAEGTEYSFSSDIASTSTRFSVVFKSAGIATGLDNTNGNQVALIYKNANNQITVNCKDDICSDAFVSVYNELGQKLYSKQITSSNTIIGTAFAKGVCVITVNNGGQRITKKIVLN
jgi:hypothetical protein